MTTSLKLVFPVSMIYNNTGNLMRGKLLCKKCQNHLKASIPFHYSNRLNSSDVNKYKTHVNVKYVTLRPHGTVDLDTCVYDFKPDNYIHGCDPVVFALHGAPGAAIDFNPLASAIRSLGIRFIAVDLPGK